MSDYKALIQRQADLGRQMEALEAAASENDGGAWTDEQRASYDTLLDQAESVNADLTRVTRRMEAEKATVRRDRGPVQTSGSWQGAVDPDERLADFATDAAPIVYRGLPGMTGEDPATTRLRVQTAFGQQLIDVYQAATRHQVSDNLRAINAAAQGAGEVIGSDGGFLVQTDVGGLLAREITTGSELLSRVRQVPLGPNSNGITFQAIDETSRATGSRYGGVQGYWVDEGTAPTASKPAFRKVELKLNKVAALGYATDELLQDAVAMGAIMFEAFTEELRWLVENAIMNGTGAGQPLGILNSDAEVSQAKEGSQTATTIVQENLSKMWSRCFARSKGRSVWFHNTDCGPELDNLYVTGASTDLEARFVTYGPDGVMRIKGRPVVETEYNATLGTVGDITLFDLSQYLFIQRALQQASSMHVAFTTDEMAFRVVWRVDGRPAWISALTPANGTNTLSPFVSLATRA